MAEPTAWQLVLAGDPVLYRIVAVSLAVSEPATALAAVLGAPLGAWVALARFPGRELVTVVMNSLMGLPPVVGGNIESRWASSARRAAESGTAIETRPCSPVEPMSRSGR